MILSGRRVNDNMGTFVANKLIKMLIKAGKQIMGSKILILGVTFKENCPDIRNSKVTDVYNELKEFGLDVDVYDYEADPVKLKKEYDIANQFNLFVKNINYLKCFDQLICSKIYDFWRSELL